jgi:predicted HicB family RNase H-like nuclease
VHLDLKGESLNIHSPHPQKELKRYIDEYLEDCKQKGKDPNKPYSGKFNLRLSPQLHSEIATAAAKTGKSLNQWVVDELEKATLAS